MSLRERMKAARKAKGMTQKDVADRLGIAKNTYCGYESGARNPNVLQIQQIARILGVTGDYLIGTSPSPTDVLYISRPSGDVSADEIRKGLHELIDQLEEEDLRLFQGMAIRLRRD